MKTLILAAGYATRLYPLTLKTPKPLLNIGKKPIIDYILDKVEQVGDMDEVFIVTNNKFYKQFNSWLQTKTNSAYARYTLINDGSNSAEDRLGAVGDIELAITKESINDDLLIIAGDNLFDFDLRQFINFSSTKKPYHTIGLYMGNNGIDFTRFGIAQLNGDSEIFSFEEKPAQPKSSYIATCVYFFPKEKLNLVSKYLGNNHHNDTPGSYISWLTRNDKVYGKIFDGLWFDLGDFESLTKAAIYLNGNQQKGLSLTD